MTKGINVALLFDDEMAQQIAELSQRVNQQMPGKYVVGENSLPHVTVAQVMTEDESVIEQLHSYIAGCDGPILKIDFDGAYANQSSSGDYVWSGLKVVPSVELVDLQRELLCIAGNNPIHNGIGDDYFPHATLGRHDNVSEEQVGAALKIESSLVQLKGVPVRLALGKSGPQYQFEEEMLPELDGPEL